MSQQAPRPPMDDRPRAPLAAGRVRITALIVARDAEADLPACLDALAFVDQIVVVVDAASRDATEAIARERADRVAVRPFDDFASQRNAALALASGDWVLAVDADERVTPELAAELRAAASDPAGPFVAYRLPIRSVVLGRAFTRSGTQHDRPIRFFRRDAGRWRGEVHEIPEVAGPVGLCRGALTHRTLADARTFLDKINRYTDLEARKLHRLGIRPRPLDYAWLPPWTFLKLYLGKGGFRDGPEGFAFCALSGVSVGVRQWKLRELSRETSTATARLRSPAPAAGGVA